MQTIWRRKNPRHETTIMNFRQLADLRNVSIPALTLGMILTCGCSSQAPLAAWQDALSAHIAREGHGDPMVIRDLPDLRSPHRARPGQIIFGEIGISGDRERDVQGVFIGHRQVAGATWFFWVVGVMQRKSGGHTDLEDLRLLAFSPQRGQLRWRLSHRDPRTAEAYVFSRAAGGLLHRGQVRGAAFPNIQDAYDLTLTGPVARVRERRSGAHWELNLSAPSGDGQNAVALAASAAPQNEARVTPRP